MQIAKPDEIGREDEIVAPEGPPPIYEILPSVFTDRAREIRILRSVAGGQDLYLGKGVRTEKIGNRVVQHNFTFPIEAADLQEAFRRFDEFLIPAGEAVGVQLRKAIIAGAAAAGDPGLVH